MTTATQAQELLVHVLDPAGRANPYPAFAQIREAGPLQIADFNLTVFSSLAACDEVFRHPSSASDTTKSTAARRRRGRRGLENHGGAELSVPGSPTTPGCAGLSARRSRRR